MAAGINIQAAWAGASGCRTCGIRQMALFADLQEADFALIHVPIDELRLPAGAPVYHLGDQGTALYTLRSGMIKLVQSLPDGAQRIVRLRRPGDTLGLEALLTLPYEHDAVVVQDALLCRLPLEVVTRLQRETPRLHTQLMRRWHQAVRDADEWLTGLSTGNARGRVARLLLHLAETGGGDEINDLFTREDLGAILGITTETASRTIAEFRRTALLETLGRNHFRCNLDGLRQVADQG